MAELELVCVPTRILTDNDDIVEDVYKRQIHNGDPGHRYFVYRTIVFTYTNGKMVVYVCEIWEVVYGMANCNNRITL